jgi:hypothetical protein
MVLTLSPFSKRVSVTACAMGTAGDVWCIGVSRFIERRIRKVAKNASFERTAVIGTRLEGI